MYNLTLYLFQFTNLNATFYSEHCKIRMCTITPAIYRIQEDLEKDATMYWRYVYTGNVMIRWQPSS